MIKYIFECLSFHSFIESHEVVEVEIKTGGVKRSKNRTSAVFLYKTRF